MNLCHGRRRLQDEMEGLQVAAGETRRGRRALRHVRHRMYEEEEELPDGTQER